MSAKVLHAIILAAGKSTRFKTEKTKLIEKLCGQEMILYVTKLLERMHIQTSVVVGYQREAIKKVIKLHHGNTIDFVVQERQHGTGHALVCAQENLKEENILIVNGDMPLITEDIIEQLYKKHSESNATVSFIIAHNTDPSTGAYGRIIQKDQFIEIVEAKDFNGDFHEHCCINAGIYIVKREFIKKHIGELKDRNNANEFYITDIVKIACEHNYPVSTISVPFDRIRGINTFKELWVVEQIKRAEIIKYWMEHGVRFSLAQSIHIDLDVSIGAGTLIDCSVHLLHGTRIGKNCIIHGFSTLSNAVIGDNTTVYPHSIICDSVVGKEAKIGPFACIHDQASIGDNAIIGNFVEVKKSSIGTQSSAKHLAYLSNATIGSNVTIGAGTITCSHDGQGHQETKIEDNVSIGSNNSLVAPVIIEKNTSTTAGAVISDIIPAHKCSADVEKKDDSENSEKATELSSPIKKEQNKVKSTHNS